MAAGRRRNGGQPLRIRKDRGRDRRADLGPGRVGLARRRMTRGRFITLEGGEGAGKSLQAALLRDVLEARGVSTLLTREPGGSPGAEEIRRLLVSGPVERWEPLAEAMLHAARAAGSSVADHRAGAGPRTLGHLGPLRGFDDRLPGPRSGAPTSMSWSASATLSLEGFKPDLTVVLDIPVAEGLRRAERARRIEPLRAQWAPSSTSGCERVFWPAPRQSPKRFAVVDARADPDTVGREILDTVGSASSGHVR